MKVFKKVQTVLLTGAFAAACIVPALTALTDSTQTASADLQNRQYTDSGNYFGSRLTDPVAKKFYDILEGMDFASGETVAITDSAILTEAEAYTYGDPSVMQKLGAAVDSFRYDHTEYFYVDFDMLTLNVKTRGETLIAELGAGRSDSYFANGFTVDNIPAAVSWYNHELRTFVTGIGVSDGDSAEVKAKAVARAVAEQVEYSFCVDGTAEENEAQPFIRTAYGALKYGKCVCEGYSRIFKAVMDELGETNVLVNGWLADDDVTEAHMWNLVNSDGKWYGVDPTVADNDSANYDACGLDWAQAELLCKDHFEDKVVSTSGYSMPFPALYRADLPELSAGDNEIEQEVNGLKVTVSQDKQTAVITYEGMDAQTLLETKGWYMAIRIVNTTDGVEDPNNLWVPFSYTDMFGYTSTSNGVTTFNLNIAAQSNVKAVQFAVCDADGDYFNELTQVYDRYTNDFFAAHVKAQTKNAFINAEHDPDYEAPIYATPDCRSISLDAKDGEQPRTVTVRYSRDLVFDNAGDTVPVISLTAKQTFDGTPYEDINEFASVTDVKLVGSDTISFVFTPSISYSHNEANYTFHVENMSCRRLNGKIEAAPDFSIFTKRTSIVCTKVYGDGRLYMQAFGTPSLVDNTDLSVEGWTYQDENGNTKRVSQSQRSQLALVVKTPQNSDRLEGAVDTELGAANVMSAATYELDLNICGRIATIPEGSYMKLSFGFPAGITPDMEGVEFEVFHFKKKADGQLDYDNPERLSCVVTKYGLTVTVNSFSPFVIVARKSTAADQTKKGVLTALGGVGGTVAADSGMPVNFLSSASDSVTYSLTPDEGYAVEYVMLGGRELTVKDGKVTVTYADLTEKDNVLSVGFAKQSVLDREAEAGEVSAAASFASKTYEYTAEEEPKPEQPVEPKPETPAEPEKKGCGSAVGGAAITAGVIVAACGIAVGAVALRKRNKKSGKEDDGE